MAATFRHYRRTWLFTSSAPDRPDVRLHVAVGLDPDGTARTLVRSIEPDGSLDRTVIALSGRLERVTYVTRNYTRATAYRVVVDDDERALDIDRGPHDAVDRFGTYAIDTVMRYACRACGWVEADVPDHRDNAHDSLCCGHPGTCADPSGWCYTHEPKETPR